jgi:hypothetical protein
MSKRWTLLLAIFLGLGMSLNAYSNSEPSRKELKAEAKRLFKNCKEERKGEKGYRKYCRKLRRDFKKDHGITFWDDLKFLRAKVQGVIDEVIGRVEVSAGVDVGQLAYTLISVETSLDLGGEFEFEFKPLYSKVQFSGGVLSFFLYDLDLEREDIAVPLPMPLDRSFPVFLEGRRFDKLLGIETDISGNLVHLYIDGKEQVMGSFFPAPGLGKAFDSYNNWKNSIPVLGGILPTLDNISLPLWYKGSSIGRITLVGSDDEGKNDGILLLTDLVKLKEATDKAEVED